jgi:hypothetical protein
MFQQATLKAQVMFGGCRGGEEPRFLQIFDDFFDALPPCGAQQLYKTFFLLIHGFS